MGNHPSNGGPPGARNHGRRHPTKAELDKMSASTGLYPTCPWEPRAIRRLIGDGRLAARVEGKETRTSPKDRECPICFLHYPQINVTQCCKAFICSECYLQVRPQKAQKPACPFCNHTKFQIRIAKEMAMSDVQRREEEEQRVIEARIRARNDNEGEDPEPRARTSSDFGRQVLQSQSSFTEDDRVALEEQMRMQHLHPLSLRIEQEAEERRSQNERNYYMNQSNRMSQLRSADSVLRSTRRSRLGRTTSDSLLTSTPGSSRWINPTTTSNSTNRDWNQIVESFERGGGQVQSLDDLVVIEAAILLSMEEEAARRSQQQNSEDGAAAASPSEDGNDETSGLDIGNNSLSSFPGVERALSRRRPDPDASLRSRFMRSSSTHMHPAERIYMSEDDQIAVAIAMSMREQERARREENSSSNNEEKSGDSKPPASGPSELPMVSEENAEDEVEENQAEDAALDADYMEEEKVEEQEDSGIENLGPEESGVASNVEISEDVERSKED